ncbi:hypothetical protein GCM10009740_13310 [Terrabacter terrae]|uniref:Secreted protein n=1 Tax=Terrabacter terrae TaxID=318434 RepID=A0ABN2TY67_9MICO
MEGVGAGTPPAGALWVTVSVTVLVSVRVCVSMRVTVGVPTGVSGGVDSLWLVGNVSVGSRTLLGLVVGSVAPGGDAADGAALVEAVALDPRPLGSDVGSEMEPVPEQLVRRPRTASRLSVREMLVRSPGACHD